MLEDDFTYVLRKAFKGLALAPGEAALRAGLPENEVLALYRGNFSPDTARRLAPVLGLDSEALARHDRYHPARVEIPGIRRLDLPFGNEQVNAWWITAGETAILFDTGNDRSSCLAAICEIGRDLPNRVFITHGHGDHVAGIPAFRELGIPVFGPEIPHANPLLAGDSFICGPLTVTAVDLSGHFTPSVGYHIKGLNVPVLVTGDALFAGSMGGCDSPALYQHALARLHAVLDPLPPQIILLPGHGPATTLGEERAGNPFMADRDLFPGARQVLGSERPSASGGNLSIIPEG